MAKISGLTPLSGINEDADTKYQDALERIQAALTARENPSIDPVMLAMAQGFLNPGKTGSFAEGLGGAAGNVLPVMAQKQKESMDNAQMRLQLAQAEREQARKTQGLQFLNDRDQPQAPPTGGAPTTGATPKGDESGPAVKTSKGMLTPRQISKIMYTNPDLGKALETEYKLELEAISVQSGGRYNKRTDKYAPFGGKTTVQRFAPADPTSGRKAMTIDMSEQDAMEYDDARTSGDYKTLTDLIDRYTKFPQPKVELPSSATPAQVEPVAKTSPVASSPQTATELKLQQEVDAAAAKKTAEKTAEANVDTTTQFKTRGTAATALIPLYNRAQGILRANPNLKNALGVLEQGDLKSAIGSVVDEGVRIGNLSISIPSFRKIASQYSQDPKTISDLAELAQVEAMWQFQQRLGLGSGTSVSNFEQIMVNQMGPNSKDPYDAYQKKLEFMKAKAEFDRDVAKKLKKGVQYEDFEDTPDFQRMFEDYQQKIIPIVYGADKAKKSTPSRSPKVSPNAKAALEAELN